MAANFKPSSFIPKEPVKTTDGGRDSRKKHSVDIFLFIAGIIFVFSLLLAGGMYGYKYYVEKNLADKRQELEEARAAFEPKLIEELDQLDARLSVAQTLLEEHTALTPAFRIIGENTLQSVQLTNFTITENEEGGASVTAKGEAEDYSGVALQSDVFGESEYIRNPIFSSFGRSDSGAVSFELSFSIAPSQVLYKNTIE